MKTFFLLFAFVPVILAYSVNGPASETSSYVFNTLLLIYIGVEVLRVTAVYHSMASTDAIYRKHDSVFYDALNAGRLGDVQQEIESQRLFLKRGAA